MSVILITGTSKGLGRELAGLYADSGSTVVGVSRNSPGIESANYHHLHGDVTSNGIERELVEFLAALQIDSVDTLINNAGTRSFGSRLSELNFDELLYQFNLHCIGALRVTKALRNYFRNSKIVNVTSRLASIEQNRRGDFIGKEFSYSYRIAKCAQNMLSLCMSGDPELSKQIIVSINPGLLQTDSGAPDARHSAREGAIAFKLLLGEIKENGIYHAFGDEALY